MLTVVFALIIVFMLVAPAVFTLVIILGLAAPAVLPPPLSALSLVSVDGVVCMVVAPPGVWLERRIHRRSSSTLCRTARIYAARSSDSPPAAWALATSASN
jgi:hypothetical protein